MDKIYGYIYIIKNDMNNKVYIGKTIQSIQKRFNDHLKDRNKRKFEKRPLYDAINKYGEKHFWVEELEKCNIQFLSEREQYWIKYFDSYKNGYNATLGGDGSVLYDYQSILNKFLEGKLLWELAEEFECDQDTIRKAVVAGGYNPKKNELQKKSRKIIQIDNKGNEIQQFNSLSDAARWIKEQTGTQAQIKHIVSNLTRVINGERKTAYKFYWKEGNINYDRRIAFQ